MPVQNRHKKTWHNQVLIITMTNTIDQPGYPAFLLFR